MLTENQATEIQQTNFRDVVKLIMLAGHDTATTSKLLDQCFHDLITDIKQEIVSGVVTPNQRTLLPLNEWCKHHDVKPVTARSWVSRGVLPHHKVGPKWIFVDVSVTPPIARKRGRKTQAVA